VVHEELRVRRGLYLGLLFSIISIMLGFVNIEGAFSLEQRVYGYVVYVNGRVNYVPTVPTYLYAWRVASFLFLEWIMTYIIGSVKQYKSLEGMGIVIGLFFIAFHYTYMWSLSSMGLGVVTYPFTYTLEVQGQSLVYLDWGQVVAVATTWRIVKNRNLLTRILGIR
jgi:hypothetical protein